MCKLQKINEINLGIAIVSLSVEQTRQWIEKSQNQNEELPMV